MTLTEEDESDSFNQMESKAIPKKVASGGVSRYAAGVASSAAAAAAPAASSGALQVRRSGRAQRLTATGHCGDPPQCLLEIYRKYFECKSRLATLPP